jgi:cell volume regulation protein A
MSESAFNDAMGAILTFTVLALIQGTSSFSLSNTLSTLGWQIIFGIVTGATLGYAAIVLIAHTKYAFLAEHAPIVTLMAVLAAYLGADGFQASGFMAVFVFGMMIGNKETFGFSMSATDHEKLDDFVITTAFIMRTFIFILLGSQVDFNLIQQYWQPGLIIVFAFMLFIRPITVFICTSIDKRANWTLNELLFMSWTRETGVIPGALAGMLIGLQIEGANMIASITLMTILMTILLQATTTRWVANKLGLLEK